MNSETNEIEKSRVEIKDQLFCDPHAWVHSDNGIPS